METKTKYCILIGLLTSTGEKVPAKKVTDFVAFDLNAFSVIKQTGYWNGQKEKSLAITYIGEISDGPKLELMCSQMRVLFSQDSVYLTQEQITLFDINDEYVPRETHNSKVIR